MKRISIRQAIIDAIEQTDENLGRFPNLSLKWAKYIEKAIGSVNGYKIKSKSFTVIGNTITLPDDCYSIIGVISGNYEDECNVRYLDSSQIITEEDTIEGADVYDRDLTKVWIPMETSWINNIAWEEVADEIHFTKDYTDKEITLVYSYIETDNKGFWIVNESHISAITKYIIYMYAKKFLWKIFKSDKLLRQGHKIHVDELKRDYNIAVRNARAEDGHETSYETKQY
jgi:hypothetical protein